MALEWESATLALLEILTMLFPIGKDFVLVSAWLVLGSGQ